jgi:hypothetical protein
LSKILAAGAHVKQSRASIHAGRSPEGRALGLSKREEIVVFRMKKKFYHSSSLCPYLKKRTKCKPRLNHKSKITSKFEILHPLFQFFFGKIIVISDFQLYALMGPGTRSEGPESLKL